MMHLLRKYDVASLRSAMMRCLPPNVAKPRIIRRSQHHLPKANIIQKSLICLPDKLGFFVGPPGGIRTPGLWNRNPLRYPASPRAAVCVGVGRGHTPTSKTHFTPLFSSLQEENCKFLLFRFGAAQAHGHGGDVVGVLPLGFGGGMHHGLHQCLQISLVGR